MKKNMIVLMAFVCLVTSHVYAQSTDHPVFSKIVTVEVRPGENTIREIFDQFRAQTNNGFDYEVVAGPDTILNRKVGAGSFKSRPLYNALVDILAAKDKNGQQLGATITTEGNKVLIFAPQSTPSPAIRTTTSEHTVRADVRNTTTPNTPRVRRTNTVSPVYTDDIVEQNIADLCRTGMGGLIIGPYAGACGPTYTTAYNSRSGIYSGRTGYHYGYLDCSMVPNHRNCTHGGLWYDSGGRNGLSERDLQGIDVYANGFNIGPASKYNSWPNKGRSLPVGNYLIQFVKISPKEGTKIVVYEEPVQIDSYYAMKGEAAEIRIDKARFNNGPHRRYIEPQTEPERGQTAEEVLGDPRDIVSRR